MALVAQSCSSSATRICYSAHSWSSLAASHACLLARGHNLGRSSSSSSSGGISSTSSKTSTPATADVASQTPTAAVVADHDDWLQRSRLLVGQEGLDKLAAVHVLVVGLGGVGSFAAECLCRAGVGAMTIVDGDTIDTSNRNRQLPALKSSIGQLKAEVVAARLRDINPHLQLTVVQEFLDPLAAAALVQQTQSQYVLDCIDSVAPKQALLLAGHAAGAHVVSSMGAGGRMDPSRVKLADISATYNDAFAAVVRRGLRKAGVASGITVVFSDELAKPASLALTEQKYKKSYFGTCSYIPALFGLYMASHVIRHVVDQDYKPPPPAVADNSSSRASSKSKKNKSCSSSTAPASRKGLPGSLKEQLLAVPASGGETARSSSSSSSSSSMDSGNEPRDCRQSVSHHVHGGSVLSSYDQSQGVGMGFDGEGL